MSPASYLTAPPRGVVSSVARLLGALLLAPAAIEQSGDHEAGAEHGGPGERVEDEVVARDDDRHEDERRIQSAGEPPDARAGGEDDAGPGAAREAGRRGRERPVDEDGDRGREHEAVAEAAEAVARAVVEPEEEDPGEEEVPDEVEDVERVYEVGHREEHTLEQVLPVEPENLLDADDLARVRERRRPA